MSEYQRYTDKQLNRVLAMALGYDRVQFGGAWMLVDPNGEAFPRAQVPCSYAEVWDRVPPFASNLHLAWGAMISIKAQCNPDEYNVFATLLEQFWQCFWLYDNDGKFIPPEQMARLLCIELLEAIKDRQAARLDRLDPPVSS